MINLQIECTYTNKNEWKYPIHSISNIFLIYVNRCGLKAYVKTTTFIKKLTIMNARTAQTLSPDPPVRFLFPKKSFRLCVNIVFWFFGCSSVPVFFFFRQSFWNNSVKWCTCFTSQQIKTKEKRMKYSLMSEQSVL